MTPEEKLRRRARKAVAMSYASKAALALIACLGFGALQWLGDQKVFEEKFRETRWEVNPDVTAVVQAAVVQAATDSAEMTAGMKSVPNSAAVKSASALPTVKTAIGASSCPGVLAPAATVRSFASREQLILAMQEQAEACVWASFRATVEVTSRKLADVGKKPPARSEEFISFADFIAREAAVARVTARAARQHVGARLMSMPLTPRELDAYEPNANGSTWERLAAWCSNKVQRAAAEDSGTHVVYEMLWYAALLLGVVASSILFVVVVTALPISSGKGYWTKRIAEILERVPTSGKSGIAVPLLAAVIGGGTLAGAVAATQAGGQGRGVYERAAIESVAASGSIQAGGSLNYRGGDVNTVNRGAEEPPFLPPVVHLDPISDSLSAISESIRKLVDKPPSANQAIAQAFSSATSRLDGVERTASETSQRVAVLQQAVADLRVELGRQVDSVEPLVAAVDALTSTVAQHEGEIAAAVRTVEESAERQAAASARNLAQTAQSDPRGFFARTFRGTVYQVGPLVPDLMAAFLEDTTDARAIAAMREVLQKMRDEGPAPRSVFETKLGEELRKRAPEHAEALLRSSRSALLKICALPRQ